MVDPLDLLLDDRSFIKIGRNVVRRGSYELHSARVRLVVGLGALKSGQERMVNIDGTSSEVATGLGSEYLHVTGEDEKLGIHSLKELHQTPLLLGLAPIDDRQVVVWHAVPFGEPPHVLVIGGDRHDLDRQCPRAPSVQDAVQAMPGPGDRNYRPATPFGFMKSLLHLKVATDFLGESAVERVEGRHPPAAIVERRAHE